MRKCRCTLRLPTDRMGMLKCANCGTVYMAVPDVATATRTHDRTKGTTPTPTRPSASGRDEGERHG